MTAKDIVNVDAILTEDIKKLLEELNLRKDFEAGKCRCLVCNDIVDYKNLKLVFPMENRQVGFLCNKPQCFVEFTLRE
jgi:hypothetical protein